MMIARRKRSAIIGSDCAIKTRIRATTKCMVAIIVSIILLDLKRSFSGVLNAFDGIRDLLLQRKEAKILASS